MGKKTIKRIAEYKRRLASLERDLFADLAKLPVRYGFGSDEEFIIAFNKAKNTKPLSTPAKASKPAKTAKVRKATKVRKERVKVTPEIIAQVKSLTEAGTPGKEIAKVTGVSLPTVQNIKKKLGLATPTTAVQSPGSVPSA